jgi:hypothetical protein
MTALSAAFGRLSAAPVARRRLVTAVPVLAATAVLFGAWYAVGALAGL